jgi:hypothetical protein
MGGGGGNGPYTLLDPQPRVNFYNFGVQAALSDTIILCKGSEIMSVLIDCEILQWCTTNFQGLVCVCVCGQNACRRSHLFVRTFLSNFHWLIINHGS